MKHLYCFCFMIFCSCYSFSITTTPGFAFVPAGSNLSVYLSDNEKNASRSALEMFLSDYTTVFGTVPVRAATPENADVLIKTLGSAGCEDWIKSLSLDKQGLKDEWEVFRIQVIRRGDRNQLVVLGSDERGTAYGILELSRMIGVSPWCWWADVTPVKKEQLLLPQTYVNEQRPSVQYRGIFINDEDWGLVPWSHNKVEQTSVKGSLGPKTYERIFQLLLRLRANILWPAMHECTKPFYTVVGNKELADKYGIVIGTSHCEQLMRNNAGEWIRNKYGDYNYLTNKETVQAYWKERLQEVDSYQNFYTVGMRGVHDGKMEGAKALDEQTKLTAEVLNDQRKLLATCVSPVVASVPQSMILYKEVLDVYNNGLKVPDDVTLVWCDDNYGYITRLSNGEEQKRKGGAGVYYHISYWGRPHDYLWLCTTPPAQIYTEMQRAWEHGSRKLWILNVGDIKPAEYETEFFLDMAWNIHALNPKNLDEHLQTWFSREFGADLKEPLSRIKQEYYRLATIRKPEFMGWSRVEENAAISGGKTPVLDTELNPFMFGDEIQKRINDYTRLADKVRAFANIVPLQRRDAYYQLMEYPVCASAAMNLKLLYAQKARLLACFGLPVANEYARLSTEAYNGLVALTRNYNKGISDGKWDGMMDMHPRDLPVYGKSLLPDSIPLRKGKPALVWFEGDSLPAKMSSTTILPTFTKTDSNNRFISLYTLRDKRAAWRIDKKPAWLKLKEISTAKTSEQRLLAGIDWAKVHEDASASCTLSVDGQKYRIKVSVQAGKMLPKSEYDNKIAWNAASYDESSALDLSGIPGLGYSQQSVFLPKGETLAYQVETVSRGKCCIRVGLIPNHPVNGDSLRYQIAVDDEQPQVISYKTVVRSEPWKINVLRNLSLNVTFHVLPEPGKHTIRIKALDNGVILDQIMLDFKLQRSFYEIPARAINNSN